jgi:hypothetical protein
LIAKANLFLRLILDPIVGSRDGEKAHHPPYVSVIVELKVYAMYLRRTRCAYLLDFPVVFISVHGFAGDYRGETVQRVTPSHFWPTTILGEMLPPRREVRQEAISR